MHAPHEAIWIMIVSALLCPMVSSGRAEADPFPQYAVIRPNVSFWIDIYSRYPTTQAVVHDSLHLNIVYETIDLEPVSQIDAREINRGRMEQATNRRKQVLRRLAADPRTQDAECRRVAALFAPGANARTFALASHRVRCQIGQRDRFQDGLIRSGAYLQQIRSILQSHGVPEALAFLPHVESSFDIDANSKFGAAGMWQFTRSTGRRFMTVDHILDERRDPIAATHAAAQLLRENYDKLGSWPLAITAYNHGAAGMQRAQAAHGDYPSIFTAYRGRSFKFASRNFYAEFLAARQVASDYERYFGVLSLKKPERLRSVHLEAFAAFEDLCRHFKISPERGRELNPALGSAVFNGQKYVPMGYRFRLSDSVESGPPISFDLPRRICKTTQKPSQFYTVQPGDTAGKIARMHQVALNDLILANCLNRRATVYARQTLRIPQPGDSVASPKSDPHPIPESTAVQKAPADSLERPITDFGFSPIVQSSLTIPADERVMEERPDT
ncbi:MAG: transglycosylase SLT domain-containing protein [Desulfosarcina sp.]